MAHEMEGEPEVDIKEQIEAELKKLDFQTKVKSIAINHYLEKKKALDEELEEKIKELTLLYEGKSAPFYKASSEIINGRKPTEEELANSGTILSDEEKPKIGEVNNEPIKEYWLKCFQNCYLIKNEIKEKDSDVLKHLQKVEYKAIDANHFEIEFTFGANEYFTNTVLKKEFFIKDDEPKKSIGTTINWKEG